MKKVISFFQANWIIIIPVLIIGLIAYVHLSPDKPEKPCLSTSYIVAEVAYPRQKYSGKVMFKYKCVYKQKELNQSITLHYTSLPPENFDRFYVRVCVKDSTDISFQMVTDSIPVKPWHRLGVEYPEDSVKLK
ncbi:MAG TPA: hypothetical protein DGG95_12260 [Cytophagales bacterium]|jgi:hypothetical protein|nr:hypothetical protein [Cytophagales bacterium]